MCSKPFRRLFSLGCCTLVNIYILRWFIVVYPTIHKPAGLLTNRQYNNLGKNTYHATLMEDKSLGNKAEGVFTRRQFNRLDNITHHATLMEDKSLGNKAEGVFTRRQYNRIDNITHHATLMDKSLGKVNMPERMDYNHRGRLWGVDLGSRGSDGHDILRNIEDPVRHVAFIKVPKAASTTMGNIFLRFGDEMNLKFALPYNGSGGYVLTPKYFYLPPRNITYDIACAHAKYNRTDYDKYLHSDTKYIAIIREPFSHFQSYIRYMRPKNLLNISGENPVFKFLFLNTIRRNKTNRVDIICNSMARYLGFPSEIFFKKRNQTLIDNYIRKLETEIDFVMIVEFFDESIVMMRRLLHWELRHVLYSKLNVNKNIDARLKFGSNEGKLHKICADLEYRLYELFLRKWMDVLRRQSSDFYDEVAYFRKIRMKYENFCLFVKSQTKLNVSLTIEGSSWNKPFTVTEGDCMKHHMDFDKYSQILFKKQQTI